MSQGPAGQLYIDIITNVAKLQSDMASMKRTVGDATGSVGGSLDKARSSTERYLASLEDAAAKAGKSANEIRKMEVAANAAAAESKGFDDLAVRIRAAGAALDGVATHSGNARAAQMELMHVVRGSVDSFASGAPVMQIFAQHIASIAQAFSMMGGSGGAEAATAGVEDLGGAVGAVSESVDKAKEVSEKLTSVLGGQAAATGHDAEASTADAAARRASAVATETSTVASVENTAAQEANAAASVTATGAAARFAGFLGSGWGIAVVAGVTILGSFVGKLFESEKATNDLTDATDIEKMSIYALIDALEKKVQADEKSTRSAYAAEQADLAAARAAQQRTLRELQTAKALLASSQQSSFGAGGASGAGMTTAVFASQVAALDKAYKDASEDLRLKYIPVVKRELTAAHDAAAAAALRNDRAEALLDDRFAHGKISQADYTKAMDRLTVQRVQDQAATRDSANGLIDAQARVEASTTRLTAAQAHLHLVKEQADKIKDPTSPQGIQLQKDLAAAYRDVASAQQAAHDDKKAAAAAAAEERHEKSTAQAAEHHAQMLARESAAMDASAKSGMALAAAYLGAEEGADGIVNSLGAAVIAEARHKAASEATKKGLDEEAQALRVLANMIADASVQAGKTVYQLRTETVMRTDLNAQLEAGKISIGEYNEQLKEGAALRPLIDLQAAAKAQHLTAAYDLLTKAIEAMKGAMADSRASQAQAAFDQAQQQGQDEIDRLKLELQLIGATNEQRAVELAMLAKKQSLKNSDFDPEQQKALIAQAGEIARQTEHNKQAQDAYNQSLTEQLDLLDALDQRARILADTLSEGFGQAGEAMGKLLTGFTSYADERQRLQNKLDDQMKAAGTSNELQLKARAEYERNAATAEQQHIGESLSAFKGLFGQKSTMYKTLTHLEQVYGALQLANNAKAIASDLILTAKSIANALARGAADAAAGAAKIFASLGPLGFPVVAAMVAVLAALGLRGLHGGGKSPTIPTAEEVQKTQGTGTVLGDSSAKSDSLAKSLDLVEQHTNKDLEYSSDMARSLRAIQTNIGSLSALIARQLNVQGGGFDTSGLGLGSKTSVGAQGLLGVGMLGGVIGLGIYEIGKNIPIIGGVIDTVVKALFGTKKTVTLIDQGFEFVAQSVGDIVNSGVVGDIYNALETQKKSKFFGISTGTKTSYSTETTPLDSSFTNQIGLLISSLRDGVVDAAKVIGVDGAAAIVDAFQLSLGKLSLQGMTGDEIEKALEAQFSKAADEMANAAVPGLEQFQQVGEGLFETLTRLARDYQVVDVALESIGKSFGAVGVASVDARENLIGLFGGLDNFTELTSQFAQSFLSEAEQMAPVQAAVAKAMGDLGLAGIATKDQFKQTVLGLDLTTEAGQQMYAQLLTIAPAFAKVQDYLAKLNGTAEDTAKTADQLAQIEKQHRSLEIQLMQAQGDAAGALAAQRADELAATDDSNKALQQAVYDALDAADAQKALADAEAAAAQQAQKVAGERRTLEERLAEALGDASTALAMKREDELAATDESNRAILQAIYNAEDLAAANDALNQTTMTAAEIAKTRHDLEIQLMEATGNAAGALAAKRADELAALDPTLRALQQSVYDAQDAADAQDHLNQVHQTAADIAKSRADMEIRLMTAQGDSAGVLAAQRAAEMAATDESNKALLQSVFDAEDAADAQKKLADAETAAAQAAQEAADQAAAIAKEQTDLQIRLYTALGDTAAATALQRQQELAATNEANRALLQSIYDAEDAADAQKKLADAQAEAAQAAQALADKQGDLQIQLLRAQGDELGAVALERQRELAALDPSLRALQEQVYTALDAADAQKKLADAQAQAAQAAQAIADKQGDLQIQLLRAQGDEIAAVALERQRELDALDPSLRALQSQVYTALDAADAQKKLADAQAEAARAAEDLASKRTDLEIRLLKATGHEMEATALDRQREMAATDASLRSLLQQVYQAEDAKAALDAHNTSLTDTISRLGDLGKSLRDFRASLYETAAATPEAAYRAAAAHFGSIALKARMGDADSLAALQSAGQDFLSASKDNAASALDYRLDVASVADAVNAAIKATDAQISDAQKQLDAAQAQIDMLTSIDDGIMGLPDAIASALGIGPSAPAGTGGPMELPASAYMSAPAAANDDFAEAVDAAVQKAVAALLPPISAIAIRSKSVDDRTQAWDRTGALCVVADDDQPLLVEVDGSVEVVNPEVGGTPVPLTTTAA